MDFYLAMFLMYKIKIKTSIYSSNKQNKNLKDKIYKNICSKYRQSLGYVGLDLRSFVIMSPSPTYL